MTGQVWTAGPFRGWPCSAEEEQDLINDARLACGEEHPRKRPSRSDITALVVALRDGADFFELREFLPGLDPARLVAAYEFLEKRRKVAADAWNDIAHNPNVISLTRSADKAAIVLPVPVTELVRVAAAAHSEHAIEHVIQAVSKRVADETAYTLEVEADLHENKHSPIRRMRIGAELFQPQHQCLWSSAYYLPRRVTDLSPLRIMDLLGERSS